MRCPKCDNEINHEWISCPHCDYHPPKCLNQNCGKLLWVPGNAAFCPNCGRLIHTDVPEQEYAIISLRDLNGVIDLLKRNSKKTKNGKDYCKGTAPGYRLYIWDDNSMSFGWDNRDGLSDGASIYIVSPNYADWHIVNCDKARFFVGDYSDGKRNGYGTCYDKDGFLIYAGIIENGRPISMYPTQGNYSIYRFELIKYVNGNYFLGETKTRKRHGKGIYIWKDGSCWYGEWKDGIRNGYGVYLSPTGECSMGKWEGDIKK